MDIIAVSRSGRGVAQPRRRILATRSATAAQSIPPVSSAAAVLEVESASGGVHGGSGCGSGASDVAGSAGSGERCGPISWECAARHTEQGHTVRRSIPRQCAQRPSSSGVCWLSRSSHPDTRRFSSSRATGSRTASVPVVLALSNLSNCRSTARRSSGPVTVPPCRCPGDSSGRYRHVHAVPAPPSPSITRTSGYRFGVRPSPERCLEPSASDSR